MLQISVSDESDSELAAAAPVLPSVAVAKRSKEDEVCTYVYEREQECTKIKKKVLVSLV